MLVSSATLIASLKVNVAVATFSCKWQSKLQYRRVVFFPLLNYPKQSLKKYSEVLYCVDRKPERKQQMGIFYPAEVVVALVFKQ